MSWPDFFYELTWFHLRVDLISFKSWPDPEQGGKTEISWNWQSCFPENVAIHLQTDAVVVFKQT